MKDNDIKMNAPEFQRTSSTISV